ncbi:MAG: peptide chain release factor N(5)-glutamine methyltransferase [Chloroflexota bacterium]
MPTIGETLQQATARLQGVSGTPRQDAQTILGHVMGDKPREVLIAHPEYPVSDSELHVFEKLLTLRKHGMPLAYIVGQRAFYDRTFRINPQVLIPRPETEHVVEAALDWVGRFGARRIIDVGTGSGVIALTLAAKLPNTGVIAADVSSAALLVAVENVNGLTNVVLVQSDLLTPFRGPFDVICANLPYIATGEMNILEVAHFEPHIALDGGSDGLVLIRRLLEQAPARLAVPGLLLIEHGADQGLAVEALAKAAFPHAAVNIIKDYAGLDRVVRVEQI